MMKTSEIIDGLEDLIQDRKSFVTPANDKFYGEDNPFKYDIAVLKAAIDKLSRRAEPENKVLTVEQLRQMDGESVWVEDIDKKQHYGKYDGYGQISVWGDGSLEDISIEAICEAPHGHTCWEEDSYGKTWLAYARKPKESEKSG